MTDDQVEKMLENLENRRSQNLREILSAILPAREDRDRLIKIEGKVEAAMTLMVTMRTEDLSKIDSSDKKAVAAHRRLDNQFAFLVTTCIVTVGGLILTALFVFIKAQ